MMAIRKRLIACLMTRVSASHEALVTEQKRKLFQEVDWRDVLEIGPGTGINLRHYPASIRLVGVEPNPFMHRYLRKEAARRGISLNIRTCSAER